MTLAQETLARAARLAELAEPTRTQLAALATVREVRAGERLFRQGEPADELGLLAAGSLKLVQVTPNGEQVLFGFVVPAELFGAVAMVPGATYPVSAQALEPSRSLTWARPDLAPLVARDPQLALAVTSLMAERMRGVQDRFRDLATAPVAARLARALRHLATQAGRPTAAGVEITLPLTREDLAAWIGTTLYSVSRQLTTWQAAGLLVARRRRLVLVDLPALRALADARDLSPDPAAPTKPARPSRGDR